MTAIDTRTEISRIDSLVAEGKATDHFYVDMPPQIPVSVEIYEVPRRAGRKPHYMIKLTAAEADQDLSIYVSPNGKSVQVVRDSTGQTE